MAAKTRDPRAGSFGHRGETYGGALANQRTYQVQSKQAGDLVDLLDTAIIDRESRANNED